MNLLTIITGYVGLAAIAMILFGLGCWGVASVLDRWYVSRWQYLRSNYVSELNQIDRYLCVDHPPCAFMARYIAERWKDGVRVNASELREQLRKFEEELKEDK